MLSPAVRSSISVVDSDDTTQKVPHGADGVSGRDRGLASDRHVVPVALQRRTPARIITRTRSPPCRRSISRSVGMGHQRSTPHAVDLSTACRGYTLSSHSGTARPVHPAWTREEGRGHAHTTSRRRAALREAPVDSPKPISPILRLSHMGLAGMPNHAEARPLLVQLAVPDWIALGVAGMESALGGPTSDGHRLVPAAPSAVMELALASERRSPAVRCRRPMSGARDGRRESAPC